MEAAILGVGWPFNSVCRQLGCPHRAALGYRVSEVAHLDYPREKEGNNPTFFFKVMVHCVVRR